MSDDAVLITVDQNLSMAPPTEPLIAGDYKLHDPQPQEIKLSAPAVKMPEPKRILKPWYEMLDNRK